MSILEKKRKTMKLSLFEGIFGLIPQRFGYDYMNAFFSKLFSLTEVGIFSSATNFAITIAPLFTFGMLRKIRLRAFAVSIAFMEAILWIVLSIYLYLFPPHFLPFLALVVVLYFVRESSSPAWRAIISGLSDVEGFERWFAERSKITTAISAIALLAAAVIFTHVELREALVILFLMSGIARLFSAYFLHLHYIKEIKPKPLSAVGRILKYYFIVVAFFVFLYLSLPFITAYMIKELSIDFASYTGVKLATLLISAGSYPLWGRIAGRGKIKPLLAFSMFGIALYPFLYLFVHSLEDVLIAEIYYALLYSAFLYSQAIFEMKLLRDFAMESRTMGMVANYLGMFMGSSIATLLIASHSLPNVYASLFLLSTGGLLLVFFLMISPLSPYGTKLREVEEIGEEVEESLSKEMGVIKAHVWHLIMHRKH